MTLEKMNVTELRAYASDVGVNVPMRLKDKSDIIKFIEERLADPSHIEKLERRKKLRSIY